MVDQQLPEQAFAICTTFSSRFSVFSLLKRKCPTGLIDIKVSTLVVRRFLGIFIFSYSVRVLFSAGSLEKDAVQELVIPTDHLLYQV